MRKNIQLKVNGTPVAAAVEPRLQLAEFLREHLWLTGTHLGCEHGVCGACTVHIDGAPARSCIAYAVACDGAEVRTIEGFDDDVVMAELREAFSAEHALQCGYCTPGMLMTARDIVLRLPHADESRIRKELAGNLCRCTGYVGIVRAIRRVILERQRSARVGGEVGMTIEPVRLRTDASARGGEAASVLEERRAAAQPLTTREPARPPDQPTGEAVEARASAHASHGSRIADSHAAPQRPQTVLHQSFTVDYPRDEVWRFFGRLDEVTTCLPGTSLIGAATEDHVQVRIRMKVGPMTPEFEGAADVSRSREDYSGVIRGAALDRRSSSATRGSIRYVLCEAGGGTATRVDIEIGYTLTGPLAQFSRSSLIEDIASRMTAAFAHNLQTRLAETQAGIRPDGSREARELDAGSLLVSIIGARVKAFFRKLLRR